MMNSCAYWVPGENAGRLINTWTQLVFRFDANTYGLDKMLDVKIKNPLPSSIIEILIDE
jgi:hypothetical protein